jgi:hypothetical protein
MSETIPAVDRIERAIARIEAAAADHDAAAQVLAERHARLKARMTEAIAALNEVIAQMDGQ